MHERLTYLQVHETHKALGRCAAEERGKPMVPVKSTGASIDSTAANSTILFWLKFYVAAGSLLKSHWSSRSG
jgi:hypothetical protein